MADSSTTCNLSLTITLGSSDVAIFTLPISVSASTMMDEISFSLDDSSAESVTVGGDWSFQEGTDHTVTFYSPAPPSGIVLGIEDATLSGSLNLPSGTYSCASVISVTPSESTFTYLSSSTTTMFCDVTIAIPETLDDYMLDYSGCEFVFKVKKSDESSTTAIYETIESYEPFSIDIVDEEKLTFSVSTQLINSITSITSTSAPIFEVKLSSMPDPSIVPSLSLTCTMDSEVATWSTTIPLSGSIDLEMNSSEVLALQKSDLSSTDPVKESLLCEGVVSNLGVTIALEKRTISFPTLYLVHNCGDGRYACFDDVENGECIDCPAGSYCESGSTEPVSCGIGEYSAPTMTACSSLQASDVNVSISDSSVTFGTEFTIDASVASSLVNALSLSEHPLIDIEVYIECEKGVSVDMQTLSVDITDSSAVASAGFTVSEPIDFVGDVTCDISVSADDVEFWTSSIELTDTRVPT
ncbi:hypothetical protein ADUPG1_000715, partial [Aduncisulcus paluster]